MPTGQSTKPRAPAHAFPSSPACASEMSRIAAEARASQVETVVTQQPEAPLTGCANDM